MFQFSYKLKVAERVKAKCQRHPRYNPERDGRGGIKGGCSTCFSLFDLHQATDEASCCDNFAAVPCKQKPGAGLTTEQPFVAALLRAEVQPL